MTKFLANGDMITLTETVPNIHEELPPAFYAVKHSKEIGLYLERSRPFDMPEKVYGDIDTKVERMTKTYKGRNGVTGVLLSGDKGAGKTLLGKKLAKKLLDEEQQPILTVDFPVSGQDFASFLQRLGQPVTLFIDEFEKIYDEGSQNGLLSLLDGVYPIKMLCILTTNDSSALTDPLLNRPGRVYYKLDYDGLDFGFIKDYVTDTLANKEHLSDFLRLATMVELNFDQLKALVEEMNRYDEPVLDSIQMLNISMDSNYVSMDVKHLELNGEPIHHERLATTYIDTDLDFEDDHENGVVQIGYWDDNPTGMSGQEFYNGVSIDNDEHPHFNKNVPVECREFDIYAYMSVFGHRLNIRSTEPMKGMPRIARMNTVDMEVRPNGLIDMKDEERKVVLTVKKRSYSTRKSFKK